jgi:hypothetical protein
MRAANRIKELSKLNKTKQKIFNKPRFDFLFIIIDNKNMIQSNGKLECSSKILSKKSLFFVSQFL